MKDHGMVGRGRWNAAQTRPTVYCCWEEGGMLTSVFYIQYLHTPPNHLPAFFLSQSLSHSNVLFLFSMYDVILRHPITHKPHCFDKWTWLCCDGTVQCWSNCVTQLNPEDRVTWFVIPLWPCSPLGEAVLIDVCSRLRFLNFIPGYFKKWQLRKFLDSFLFRPQFLFCIIWLIYTFRWLV